jgi:hypothetical protein
VPSECWSEVLSLGAGHKRSGRSTSTTWTPAARSCRVRAAPYVPVPSIPTRSTAGTQELVLARATFPELGQQAYDWTRLSSLIAGVATAEVVAQVLDMIDKDLVLHHSTPEARLLVHLAATDPRALWEMIGEQLERGNWKLSMSIRGWLTSSVDVDVLRDWVGGRLDRARLLANVASAGEDAPSPLALYLLTDFGTDDEVRSGLAADFVSGAWSGPWSGRIRHQLDALSSGWDRPEAPDGVRSWSHDMRERLKAELVRRLEREAEQRF